MGFSIFTYYVAPGSTLKRRWLEAGLRALNRHGEAMGVQVTVFYGKDLPPDGLRRGLSNLRWWRIRDPVERSHVLFLNSALRRLGDDVGVYCAAGVVASHSDIVALANGARRERDTAFSWLSPRPLRAPLLGCAWLRRARGSILEALSVGHIQGLIMGGLSGEFGFYGGGLYSVNREALLELLESLSEGRKRRLLAVDGRRGSSGAVLSNFYLLDLISRLPYDIAGLPFSTSRYHGAPWRLFSSLEILVRMIGLSLGIRQKVRGLTQMRFFYPVMQTALWGALITAWAAPVIGAGMFLFFWALSIPILKRFPLGQRGFWVFLGYALASLFS